MFLMRRRATSKMSFINGGLSEKTVFGCNTNSDMRERRESSSFPSYLVPPNSNRHHHHFLARCTIIDDSSELSIFDAKKYFNEVSPNNINKVSPITTIEPIPMPEQCIDHPVLTSQDHDLDKDSELSKSKPWTCGSVTLPSSGVVSKFSPSPASIDGYRQSYRARSFHSATPTTSSEASWNSQAGLLSNPPGAISVSVLRGGSGHHSERKTPKPPSSLSSSMTGRWVFGSFKCPCTGKKSVQVRESKVILDQKTSPCINNSSTGGSNSQSQPESLPSEKISGENTMLLQHSDNNVVWSTQRRFPPSLLLQGSTTQRVIASTGFTFPILKTNTNNNNGDFPIRSLNPILIEDPPRDSLEVFKPSSVRDGGGGSGLKSRILASVAASGGNATIVSDIDDVASDASSDLFEIESFSTKTASTTTTTTTTSYPAMFHRRDSMELEARRLALATVATRRSLDESMTPSTDWYEPSEASIDWSVTTAEGFDRASIANMSEAEEPWNEKNNNNNNRRRLSSGNGLLSCRSEKAVSVGAPQPVTKHMGSRPPLGKKPPLARSNSARLSLTFAA